MNKILIPVLILIFSSCQQSKNLGSIQRIDPSLDSIVSPDAEIEIIADGFKWTEGPLWLEDKKMLLFSDVFSNKVYKWTEGKKADVYVSPSGYTATTTRGGEIGSNGLLLDNEGKLVLCQHGNRQVARMNADLSNPKSEYVSLASAYQDKRLNSPNDATFDTNGNLFFTDPPYGLEKNMADPAKEISFQGVYKAKLTGELILLCDTITRPNGIAFFPGEKTLLVANSDSLKPFWYSFDVANDTLTNARIFYNAGSHFNEGKGLPDGLKIDKNGNVFATGPGGVFIFSRQGKLLGKIKLPVAPSNCAFSADQKTLFITATNYVLRLKMR
ncbi:SMP-30/gluconolactonase/LRE family protein [Segetibacter aerophilus]|uniref:Gluconolactonase n=1 Tax=Segetibacter aerophilus TaxID=670293 RepID=A0A512BI99_9BACT|nr:SMP-30/gluconolactonase/LRE family protein [Segetibacter aerophilus]GEO11709.1 gluconolactonase [Segetibacter aerophilus]